MKKMKYQESIEYGKQKIEQLQAAIDLFAKLPPLEGYDVHISENLVVIQLPYDVGAYRQLRRLLGDNVKQAERQRVWSTCQHGDTMHRYTHLVPKDADYTSYWQGPTVRVQLDPSLAKSTCKLNLTGYSQVPVWEVVCE